MVMNGDLKLPCRGKMVEVALEDKVRHPSKKSTYVHVYRIRRTMKTHGSSRTCFCNGLLLTQRVHMLPQQFQRNRFRRMVWCFTPRPSA